METFLKDLHFGLRSLRKNPGFAAIAVLTLALGIGANTAIFSVINGVLLQPLPLPEPDRLVQLWEVNQKGGQMTASYLNYLDWRERSITLEYLSLTTGGRTVVLGGSEPVRVPVMLVGRDFFSVMDVQPQIGRAFSPDESRYSGTPEAIVSRGFWQRQLGSNPDLGSLTLKIHGFDFPIVGMMPGSFDFPTGADVWIPGDIFPPPPPEIIPRTRTGHNYRVVARLGVGVSLSQAQAEMTTIAKQLQEEHKGMNDAVDVRLVPLQEQLVGRSRLPLLILLGASGLLLLLACANVANLLLARSAARQAEFAVRTALGATLGRLVRQLLTESVLVSLLGGAAGLLLGWWVLRFLPLLSPGNLPRLNEISLDGYALGFTLVVSLGTGLLFGLAPAFQVSSLNLHSTLKEGGRGGGNAQSSKWFRDLLVVAEVALAVVLLIGAGLLIGSLQSLLTVNPGFNPESVLTVQLSLPAGTYPGTPERAAFQQQLFERMKGKPGIASMAAINSLPLTGFGQSGTFLLPGRPEESGYADYRNVSPDYFSTLTIPLLAGRFFEESDNISAPHVAIISQSAKDKYWPMESPLGRTILSIGLDPDERLWKTPITIVGVVGDIHHSGLDQESSPTLYVPYAQRSNFSGFTNLVIRTKGDPLNLVSPVRQEILSLDPNVPSDFQTMDAVVTRSYSARRFRMNLFGSFAFIGLLLAAIGIYGVISYSVSYRINEFGIRRALGAQNSDILYLVLRYGLLLAGIGVAVGLAGAYAATQLMASLLYGVTATDPATFGFVSALLLFVALLACYIPGPAGHQSGPDGGAAVRVDRNQ